MKTITQQGETRAFIPQGSAGSIEGALSLVEKHLFRKNPRIDGEAQPFGRLMFYHIEADNLTKHPDSFVILKRGSRFLVGWFFEPNN